jgi:hypothetical protein
VEELVDAVAGVAGDDAVALGLDDALDDVSDLAARSAEESEKGEGKDVRRKGIDQHNDPGQGELRRSRVVMVEESWEGVEGRKEGRRDKRESDPRLAGGDGVSKRFASGLDEVEGLCVDFSDRELVVRGIMRGVDVRYKERREKVKGGSRTVRDEPPKQRDSTGEQGKRTTNGSIEVAVETLVVEGYVEIDDISVLCENEIKRLRVGCCSLRNEIARWEAMNCQLT